MLVAEVIGGGVVVRMTLDDGDSSTWVLYVWLFVQIQVIFALLYFIVRIVVCPLCCGRRADPPPLSADAVRRNFEELRARAESKRADRAARIAAGLAALAAPVAELAGMESAAALRRFRDAVAAHTLCPFARKAVVWADPLPRPIADDDVPPLDAEAVAAVPIFARWSLTAFASKLDGFLLARQLPRDRFLDDSAPPSPAQIASGHVLLYNLSLWLRVSLHTLSLSDPGGDGRSCIVNDDDDDAEFYVPTGRRGWRFRFADEAFFITLFAPAYGPEHPRHCTGDWSFILLQPDFSFSLTHNVGLDHPSMPPDAPPDTWTMRERVRRRFLAANRMYYVPIAHAFPQATLYIPHHDAALAEDGWHWQWWLDQPSIAQGGDRKLRAAAATAAEAKSNQTKTKPKTN
jgi:hypothetical protein